MNIMHSMYPFLFYFLFDISKRHASAKIQEGRTYCLWVIRLFYDKIYAKKSQNFAKKALGFQ